MKSLKWQFQESCATTCFAIVIILITIWWTWYGVAFAAGMIFATWINYGDHKHGTDCIPMSSEENSK